MYCEKFGFSYQQQRAGFLSALELGPQDQALAADLQRLVIVPNVRSIVDAFYKKLLIQPEFARILRGGDFDIVRLKQTQAKYLLTLGVDFHEAAYFEERLRVGLAHAWAGVPLSVTQAGYRLMQQLLVDRIPRERNDAGWHDALVAFIIKILALDLSLIMESYHGAQVKNLEDGVSALRKEEGDLHGQVSTDTLTGLASRRHILTVLEAAMRSSTHSNTPTSLIMVDVDRFKHVNDIYGHPVGDDALRRLAARMKRAVREVDTVGRYGGEEFLTVLPDTSLASAWEIAERMRARVATRPIHCRGRRLHLTISLDVAQARPQDIIDTLVTRADSALYAAKKAGRNRTVADEDCAARRRSS